LYFARKFSATDYILCPPEIAMSSPRKEAGKEKKEHDKEDENPTNVGPGITESYDE